MCMNWWLFAEIYGPVLLTFMSLIYRSFYCTFYIKMHAPGLCFLLSKENFPQIGSTFYYTYINSQVIKIIFAIRRTSSSLSYMLTIFESICHCNANGCTGCFSLKTVIHRKTDKSHAYFADYFVSNWLVLDFEEELKTPLKFTNNIVKSRWELKNIFHTIFAYCSFYNLILQNSLWKHAMKLNLNI